VLFFSDTLHLCNDARQQKENEMESLKDLITAQKLLEFEIAQTKKSKELKAIKAKIAAIMAPAKLRAEKLANRRGYTEEINKAGKVIYKSEGKFPVNGETAMYKVTKSEVTAHERTSVRIDMV
jgi:hypothetical protein